MNRKMRKKLKQACQFALVVTAVATFTLGLYALSRALRPVSDEKNEDEKQINEMRNYHHSQGRTDLLFF